MLTCLLSLKKVRTDIQSIQMTVLNPPNFLLSNYFEFFGFSELSRVLERKTRRACTQGGKRERDEETIRNAGL